MLSGNFRHSLLFVICVCLVPVLVLVTLPILLCCSFASWWALVLSCKADIDETADKHNELNVGCHPLLVWERQLQHPPTRPRPKRTPLRRPPRSRMSSSRQRRLLLWNMEAAELTTDRAGVKSELLYRGMWMCLFLQLLSLLLAPLLYLDF